MPAQNKREARASLSSRFSKKTLAIRPPYAHDLSLFQTHCPTCVDTPCISACEEDIIKLDADGAPLLDFTISGCTFCHDCADACPNGVLTEFGSEAIAAKFSIDTNTCLAWNDVMCSSCLDACDARAVIFFGVFRPVIDADICTACGFCYGVCPPYAIKYKGIA